VTGYWDIVIVLVIAGAMLSILDWRINRAFIQHEKREAQMVAEVSLSSDAALALVREGQRHIREIEKVSTLHGIAVQNLSDEVRMHDKRLGAVEERIMRAALTVPHQHRRENDP
jgi:hypothetical protein